VRVSLLGPIRLVGDGGTPVDIGGARLRMLLARLALDAGRSVSSDSLVDGLWGDQPPADASNALQSLVSRLRKVLREAGAALETTATGYQLGLNADSVDTHRFEILAARGRGELAAGRFAESAATLHEALALWHGEALADVLEAPFAPAPAARLTEMWLGATEDRIDAELLLGRHGNVLADLEATGAQHPLRERLAGLRMRALSAAGRQSEALAVYESLRGTLSAELGIDPSAELREIHLAVLRGQVAKPASRPVAVDRLPVRVTSFVGREDELKLLGELLSNSRLVTLVGPGGAGKTRLATETAARLPARDHGRVWFVALAGVRDPGDVTVAVLAALGLREIRLADTTTALRPPADALDRVVEVLAVGDPVLVLDNCEHLVGAAAALVHELITRVPRLRVLATSREPLAIDGETLCPLGPLEVPGERVSVAAATGLGAVRLFMDRATAVRPAFVLDESTVRFVAEICRRLDGMPLALELAAARLRSMTVGQITQRLDDRFRLLTSGSRAALPRQRTLRAVVEWSWDLLDEPERVLARRLSVFPDGARVSAVEAVCADSLVQVDEVLYILGSLVEKSIVDAVPGERDEPRYRMLETIRVYADERLDEAGEREATRKTLARYYVELAERYESVLRTREQMPAIAWYDTEYENLVSVLRRAIDESDADTAYRLTGAIFWYWLVRGNNEQVNGFVRDVLRLRDQLPEHVGATFAVIGAMDFTVVPAGPWEVDPRVLIDDCVRTGAMDWAPGLAIAMPMLAFFCRDMELARREVDRVLTSTDPWIRAAGHWVESFLLSDAADLAGCERARKDALAGFQAVGDRWGIAMTLSMQAEELSRFGDSAGAISAYQEGFKLAAELRSEDDMVQQLWRLALERSRAGDLPGAWREMNEADAIARRSANTQLSNMVLFGQAELSLRSRDLPTARDLIMRMRVVVQELPFPPQMAEEWVATFEAKLAFEEERFEDAVTLLGTAIRSTTDRHDMPDVAQIAELLALIRGRQGATEAAVTLIAVSEAVRGAFDFGNPDTRALVAELTEELGDQRYLELYQRSSSVSKAEGVELLRRDAGVSPSDAPPVGPHGEREEDGDDADHPGQRPE
jgi:predicted ATPase/DNA-binding SARP family transcriptional activator